jgi:uncharacterized membrane protein YgaE (UPF0421/DUF939 family)
MADETKTDPGKNDPATKEPKNEPVSLTQDELNRLLGKVREESRSTADKEYKAVIEKMEREAKLSSMKEDERKAAEAKMKEDATQKELNELRRNLAMKDAEAELRRCNPLLFLRYPLWAKDRTQRTFPVRRNR